MDKILINDLLRLSAHDISNTRLKLNVFNGNTDPLEEYKKDPDKINTEWFLWHNQRRYFHTGQIAICLLYLHDDKWLLTTIKRIVKNYTDIQLKTFIHGMEAFNMKIIMRRDSVILSKSRNRF